jgi:two-component system, chemotaxis family, chemotaxis protein CheY
MDQQAPILAVDDDPSIRTTVADILSAEGYRVITAANGVEALSIIEQVHPALILLDMRMPVMDGWAFARELAARRMTVPVVVMTAAQDARRWAQEIGAAAALAKPFDLLDLLDVVEKVRSS